MSIWRGIAAILGREVRLSLRHGADSLAAVMFFVVAASLFPLAIGPAPETLARIAPGIVWVCALLAALLPAQNAKSQEQLIALRKEKLAKEVFQKAPWRFDFDAARKEAKESGKPLFVYFTRSYAG